MQNTCGPTLYKPSHGSNDHDVQPLKKKTVGISLRSIPISIFQRISLHGNGLKIAHLERTLLQIKPLFWLLVEHRELCTSCLQFLVTFSQVPLLSAVWEPELVSFDGRGEDKEIRQRVTAIKHLSVMLYYLISG